MIAFLYFDAVIVFSSVIVCNYVHMLEHFDDIIAITVVLQYFANGTVVQVWLRSCASPLRLWNTFTVAALYL